MRGATSTVSMPDMQKRFTMLGIASNVKASGYNARTAVHIA